MLTELAHFCQAVLGYMLLIITIDILIIVIYGPLAIVKNMWIYKSYNWK